MDTAYRDGLRRRREEILARIDAALAASGRGWDELTVIAVSKTVDADAVRAAIAAGYRAFGENRPQELVRKLSALAETPELPPVRFDMIGNLQTNKINAVLGRAELIHSVSSLHLARAVAARSMRRMEADGASAQPVLLEVNISGEESKSGFSPDELRAALPQIEELCGIRVRGLMSMAPRGNKDVARACFARLRELRDELAGAYPALDLSQLSCGMSEDFECAIEEGSTIVRLGRVVFDPSFALQ